MHQVDQMFSFLKDSRVIGAGLINHNIRVQTEIVHDILRDHVQSIQDFVERVQTVAQPRDDYKELLDLTHIP